MKKYLILLIIPLLFFSTGCEEDDNLEEVTGTVIDENLIGVWKLVETDGNDDYYRSFSSNGRWGYWNENLFSNGQLSSISDEQTGDFWIQDNVLLLDYDDSPTDDIMYYTVTENTLTLNEGVWEKQ
tara:strand:+ start:108 stop:485 length:378 start_codon:yes stop_codon:yes gene_type:complete